MPTGLTGSIVRTEGLTAAVAGFPAPVGALVEIERQAGRPVEAEVIGFRNATTLVYPLGELFCAALVQCCAVDSGDLTMTESADRLRVRALRAAQVFCACDGLDR